MKKYPVHIICLLLIMTTTVARADTLDSIVENCLALSEAYLYEADFEEAEKYVDTLFFEKFKRYEKKHAQPPTV